VQIALGGAALLSSCRYGYELSEQALGGSAGSSGLGATSGLGGSGSASGADSAGGAADGGDAGLGVSGDDTGGVNSGGAAGASPGGTAGSGAASGGTGGATSGDLVVTTGVDENDTGATAAAPGGTGLSLREAITLANATAGVQVITFEAGVVVALTNTLPTITDGATIRGGSVDGSGAPNNKECLFVNAGPTTIDGLEISGCRGRPIYVTGGDDVHVENCYFHESGAALEVAASAGAGTIIGPGNTVTGSPSHCVSIYNNGALVVDNRITDCAGNAVFLSGTVAGVDLVGNLMLRTNFGVGMGSGTSGANIWFNTIAQSANSAINVGQAANNDVRDNVLAYNGQFGVVGADVKFTQLDYNLYFANGSGACNPCSVGTHSLLVDPLFVSTATDDYTLKPESPAIDAGTSLGVDRNGAAAGDFNGSLPDLGYRESP
jgi:hypothetical protein